LQERWDTEDGLTLPSPFAEFAENGGNAIRLQSKKCSMVFKILRGPTQSFMHSHYFLLFLVFKVQHPQLKARAHDDLQTATCCKTIDIVRLKKKKKRRGLTTVGLHCMLILRSHC
jgi:hypothetical protein